MNLNLNGDSSVGDLIIGNSQIEHVRVSNQSQPFSAFDELLNVFETEASDSSSNQFDAILELLPLEADRQHFVETLQESLSSGMSPDAALNQALLESLNVDDSEETDEETQKLIEALASGDDISEVIESVLPESESGTQEETGSNQLTISLAAGDVEGAIEAAMSSGEVLDVEIFQQELTQALSSGQSFEAAMTNAVKQSEGDADVKVSEQQLLEALASGENVNSAMTQAMIAADGDTSSEAFQEHLIVALASGHPVEEAITQAIPEGDSSVEPKVFQQQLIEALSAGGEMDTIVVQGGNLTITKSSATPISNVIVGSLQDSQNMEGSILDALAVDDSELVNLTIEGDFSQCYCYNACSGHPCRRKSCTEPCGCCFADDK